MSIVGAMIAVFLIIFLVPIAVYGAFSAVTGLQTPGDSPLAFLGGVAVSKAGTAVAFVLLYALAQPFWAERWLRYAAIWLLMLVAGEIGQALGPGYGWQEAIAGILSETIYFPASAYLLTRVITA